MPPYQITVIDDELANLESLERILRSDGAQVNIFQQGKDALESLKKGGTDIVMTDLRMNCLSGMEILETVKHIDPSVVVILMTAYGTVEVAVEAMKKGAYDFITKPLQKVQVLKTVHRALEKRRLLMENDSLKDELKRYQGDFGKAIVGKSQSFRQVMDLAQQAAASKASVFIEGESGTGKGVLAEFLHNHSELSQGLFVNINCAAIPENLLEAELFGFEAGAFTDAKKMKKGRVELAHNGTLFLDEIGIAPLSLQSKLLKFVQEGEFERLGSNQTQKVEARVISATNSPIKELIKQGSFREDLYYRLNVVHLEMPPLRQRQEDIPLLAQQFLNSLAKKNGRKVPELSAEAREALISYSWPGNIRELQNLMERLVVLHKGGQIGVNDLPREFGGNHKRKTVVVPIGLSLRQVEKIVMDETLKSADGDRRLAARLLGVHPRTIGRHLDASQKAKSSLSRGNLPAQSDTIKSATQNSQTKDVGLEEGSLELHYQKEFPIDESLG